MTIPYPHISPEIFRIGPIAVRWYGVMYVIGFVVGGRVARDRVRRHVVPFDEEAVDRLIGYLLVGLVFGARLTYILVYDRATYIAHPLEAFAIWHGGLSFHGAVLGMTCACFVFARRRHVPFSSVADTLALAGAPGLFFGRLGNFINAELYGRPTKVPWAMIFPTDPQGVPRHPSQLYEAFAEGIVLYLLLRALERRALADGWYRPGLLAGAFLVGYGVLRFLIEFTRQPDVQLGLVAGPFSMGQLLCGIMILCGGAVFVTVYRGDSAAITRS